MARTMVTGHGHELYHRAKQREIIDAAFPRSDEAPRPDASDADNLYGWMIDLPSGTNATPQVNPLSDLNRRRCLSVASSQTCAEPEKISAGYLWHGIQCLTSDMPACELTEWANRGTSAARCRPKNVRWPACGSRS